VTLQYDSLSNQIADLSSEVAQIKTQLQNVGFDEGAVTPLEQQRLTLESRVNYCRDMVYMFIYHCVL
jgi:hypothetical protein